MRINDQIVIGANRIQDRHHHKFAEVVMILVSQQTQNINQTTYLKDSLDQNKEESIINDS